MRHVREMIKKASDQNGYALPFVIVIFAVMLILATSLIVIANANTKQVTVQEENMRAYYLAKSGIEITYAALMENSGENFERFLNDSATTELSDTLSLPDASNPIGTVEITVSKETNEVKILARSIVGSDGGTTTLALYIENDNVQRMRWERN